MFTSNHRKSIADAVCKAKQDSNSPYGRYFAHVRPVSRANSETELDKFYTFDNLGHIMVATTSKNVDTPNPDLLTAFQKVMVFYGAWTAAFSRAGKTLFDFDAVNALIAKSGFFVNTQKESRSFHTSSTTATLDTQIIASVLSEGVTGGAMAIAQRTLAAIGGQLKASYSEESENKEICHLLFIVEELLGMPIISASIFHTTYKQLSWVQTTNCSEVAHTSVDFDFQGDDYLFVDPQIINKFSPDFVSSPDYNNLIDTLVEYITK